VIADSPKGLHCTLIRDSNFFQSQYPHELASVSRTKYVRGLCPGRKQMLGFVRLGAALQKLANCIGCGFTIFPGFLVKFARNLGKLHPAPLQELGFLSQIILSRSARLPFWHKELSLILSSSTGVALEPLSVLPPLGGYLLQDSLVFGRASENLFSIVHPLQNLGLR
jgi:hypothetical protein